MRALARRALALLALVLLPSAAFAQLGTLQGEVTDTSGAVLPGVTVEASSPVLLQPRVTVTGGEGRYTIVQLQPGTYTVTFTLPGFATAIQETVQVSTAGAAVVNAVMQVGGLEETVTVTGEAPVVDVTTATRAAVLSADTVDALPTSRNYLGLARLIPGTSGGDDTDVGGSRTQGVGGQVSIHGSRPNDQRVTLNGVMTQTLQAGGGLGGQVPDMGTAAEVTVEHTAVSAELAQGGVRINFVPRDGGNTFSTSDFFTFSNESMQGDNFTQELQDAGLGTPNRIDRNYDFNFAFGGPIAQDRVWFWFSGRRNQADFFTPVFWNQNAFNPNSFLYEADTTRPGEEFGTTVQSSLRITWQASPRNKIAGTYKRDRWCQCPQSGGATESPEAGEDFRFPRLTQEHLEWTSPISNNLLLEAVGLHLFERWGNMHPHQTGPLHSFSDIPEAIANVNNLVSIQDQGLGNLTYGLNNTFNNTLVPNYAWRVAATYVTGTHNVKVGVNGVNGFLAQTQYKLNNVSYRVRTANGVTTPNRVTINGTPTFDKSTQDFDLGFFLQDTVTLDRVTLGGAIRYDMLRTGYPDGVLGQSEFTPNREFAYSAGTILDFTDVTWRSSVTYDLFGTGRTAIKATASKYLEGQTLNGIGRAGHPVARLANSTNINWHDDDGDFFPDCDLLNPLANGECSAWQTSNFGDVNPAQSFSGDLLTGFGNREANWEYSAGIQHELTTGVSIDVGYFRRNWQNLQVTDNRNLTAQDFTFFDLVVPSDARLPDGGGYTLTGFRAITEAGQAKPEDEIDLRAKEIGDFTETWQGVDVNLNARLQNGLQLQFGTSTGRTGLNDCALTDQLPERDQDRAIGFCDRTEPYQTQLKGYAVYTIPTIDVQISGTFRSTPGDFVNANFNATNAYLAANSTLGRPLAGGASNITVELIEPNTVQLDRLNQLDLRFGKVFRIGGARSVVSLDLFNALNIDAVLNANQTFNADWLAPQSILDARVAKISLQFDW
jgi:hypothetical protein